jgi:sensor histidine kinase YesM
LTWSLADLLRATLRKTEELIPVCEEISLLNSYLHIQQTRFNERISFELRVEDDTKDLLVPCMIFQPLVENAIIHGLESVITGGKVSISVFSIRGHDGSTRLYGIVKDNGVGFDPVSVEQKPGKIGLLSTRNRLEHYFGQAGSLEVYSRPGKGSCVKFKIPARKATDYA